jgi:hypothetical protein
MSSRGEPSICAIQSRVRAASSVWIAFISGVPHSALSTAMSVSLSRKTSLSNASRVKQSTHLPCPQRACGVVCRNPARVGRSACHQVRSAET